MCSICDGYSEDDLTRQLDLTIRVHGFSRVGVENPDGSGWTYTIGLAESFGQPDLVCIEIEPEAQRILVQAVGAMIAETGSAPDPGTLAELDLELVAVHPGHLRGDLVACWEGRYQRRAGEGDFLQVLPGPSHFCACHGAAVRRLDDPRSFRALGPNRAERRAQRRGARKRGRPPR